MNSLLVSWNMRGVFHLTTAAYTTWEEFCYLMKPAYLGVQKKKSDIFL